MKVGIDATALIYQRGVSRYTRNLIQALLTKTEAELALLGYSLRSYRILNQELKALAQLRPAGHRPEVLIKKMPPSLMARAWRWHFMSVTSLLPSISVFHSWDWIQPPDTQLPLVSTIHDLALLKYPEVAHPTIKTAHERAWKILKERSAHLIAVSQATKEDVVTLLDIPPERVHVVYEALPQEFKSVSDTMTEQTYESIKNRLELTQPYLLFIGTQEPRKNLKRLIDAWKPLKKEVHLIIAGASGWDKQLSSSSIPAGVRILGSVSDAELVVLYGEAKALVFPSLDEGFGLPILEAFSLGTPVVTSNVSALKEVAGNAAELVDPTSVESIRSGIETVLAEKTAESRARLQKMILRLQLFSWKRVAEQTLAVYQQAAEERS